MTGTFIPDISTPRARLISACIKLGTINTIRVFAASINLTVAIDTCGLTGNVRGTGYNYCVRS